jgi:hypothetical protein
MAYSGQGRQITVFCKAKTGRNGKTVGVGYYEDRGQFYQVFTAPEVVRTRDGRDVVIVKIERKGSANQSSDFRSAGRQGGRSAASF